MLHQFLPKAKSKNCTILVTEHKTVQYMQTTDIYEILLNIIGIKNDSVFVY